jgi:putative spermidine/putrescine transport system ATP-binding protein
LNSGKLEQEGTPLEVYSNPVSLFAARFLEMTNIFPGVIQNMDGKIQVSTDLGTFPIDSSMKGNINVLIRPDMVRIDSAGPVLLHGVIKEVSFRGSMKRIKLLVNQQFLTFEVPSLTHIPNPGSELTISIDPSKAIKVFPIE